MIPKKIFFIFAIVIALIISHYLALGFGRTEARNEAIAQRQDEEIAILKNNKDAENFQTKLIRKSHDNPTPSMRLEWLRMVREKTKISQ